MGTSDLSESWILDEQVFVFVIMSDGLKDLADYFNFGIFFL